MSLEVDDPISFEVIGAAIEEHRHLGPGLLESAYEECLCHELNLRGIKHLRQETLPLVYKGLRLKHGFRIDILIPEKLVVELKSLTETTPVHEAQLLTYLKLTNIRSGLLLNFNVAALKNGITRKFNGPPKSASS